MFLLLSDPWLLSELCLHSTCTFLCLGKIFWDQWKGTQGIQYMDQKFPGSCPVHVPHFSPLPGDCSKGGEPLDKTHHLLSGVVVQLVAWEPDSVCFPLFFMERKQQSNGGRCWKPSQPSCSSLQPERLASPGFSGLCQELTKLSVAVSVHEVC